MTAPGDTGFFSGSITYAPPSGSTTMLSPVTVPLGSTDSSGTSWLIVKLEGWDGPDVQGGGVIPRAGDHGGWAGPQYYAGRAITLTVQASAQTQALRDAARAQLQQAVPVSDLALFTYDEPAPKSVMVRRSGKVTETYQTLCDVSFSIILVAPDPRKYGAQVRMAGPVNAAESALVGFAVPFTAPFSLPGQSPSGSLALTNAGTFESRPLITITGPITAPTVTNVTTGQTVSWSLLSLGASDVLTANFATAQSYLNGSYVPADMFSAWWSLPPGTSTIQIGGSPQPGASLAASWQDAYI